MLSGRAALGAFSAFRASQRRAASRPSWPWCSASARTAAFTDLSCGAAELLEAGGTCGKSWCIVVYRGLDQGILRDSSNLNSNEWSRDLLAGPRGNHELENWSGTDRAETSRKQLTVVPAL
jgi:hypothetical protein